MRSVPESNSNVPATLGEAVNRLRGMLRTEERETIAELPEQSLFELHAKLRLLIQARFGLVGPDPKFLRDLGTGNSDVASFRIVEELWRALRVERSG